MGRILFFLLLAVGLYVAFRLWLAGSRRNAGMHRPQAPATGEPIVRCEHCGLNVPQSEALGDGTRWYCSEAHRRLGRDER
jgi:uncharacterized protein